MSDMAKSFDSLEYNVKYIGVLVVHVIKWFGTITLKYIQSGDNETWTLLN